MQWHVRNATTRNRGHRHEGSHPFLWKSKCQFVRHCSTLATMESMKRSPTFLVGTVQHSWHWFSVGLKAWGQEQSRVNQGSNSHTKFLVVTVCSVCNSAPGRKTFWGNSRSESSITQKSAAFSITCWIHISLQYDAMCWDFRHLWSKTTSWTKGWIVKYSRSIKQMQHA